MNGSSIAQQLVPTSILEHENKMMALAKDNPQEFLKQLKNPPIPSGDITQALAGLSPIGGITKAELKMGVRPAIQIAEIAKKGSVPTVPLSKMWPAAINEATGEVAHVQQPGVWMHEPLLKSLKNSVRGWVDPVTWKAYTDKAINDVSHKMFDY